MQGPPRPLSVSQRAHARRLVRAYGTRAAAMLHGTRNIADLGLWFGGDLNEAEVRFLREQEWAVTAEDILWRRTKLGLTLTRDGGRWACRLGSRAVPFGAGSGDVIPDARSPRTPPFPAGIEW